MERDRYYADLDTWRPILQADGVAIVNLQYDDAEAELARAEVEFGVAIQRQRALAPAHFNGQHGRQGEAMQTASLVFDRVRGLAK